MIAWTADLHIACMVKGRERYIWLYAESRLDEALSSVGAAAADERLSFTGWDAACLAQEMRSRALRTKP